MKAIFLLCFLILGCNKENIPIHTIEEHNFELVQLGSMRRDQFMIDKKTGKLWRNVCLYSKPKSTTSECDYSGWIKESVQDIDGSTIESMTSYADMLKKKE